MRRRELIASLLLVVAPERLQAQQTSRVYRLALLEPRPIAEMTEGAETVSSYRALFGELRRLGYTEGVNLLVDRFSTGGHDNKELAEVVRDVIRRNPDLIVSTSTPAALALQKETRTIPIVFLTITDPVGSGLVSNLTQPGGNITGFTDYENSLGGKWLELLTEISPATTRVATPFNEATAPWAKKFIQSAEAAASRLSVSLSANDIRDLTQFKRAIAAFAAEPNGGLVVIPDAFLGINYELVIELAHEHHLPAIYPWAICPRRGGLASYNFNDVQLFRAGAGYIDRIFRGRRPSELPVEAPSKFDLVINLKTAKQLGLTISPSLLARADDDRPPHLN